MAHFHEKWIAKYERERDSIACVRAMDPFSKWERNRAPDLSAYAEFCIGVPSLYANPDDFDGRAIVRRSIDMASRALQEGLSKSTRGRAIFPQNRGLLTRLSAIAGGIINGGFDQEGLARASNDYLASFIAQTGGDADETVESLLLTAIRLAMLSGDASCVSKVRQQDVELEWHGEEYGILKPLLTGAHNTSALEQYFDRIRDPAYKSGAFNETELVRIEIAAIVVKLRLNGSVDWQQVISEIGR